MVKYGILLQDNSICEFGNIGLKPVFWVGFIGPKCLFVILLREFLGKYCTKFSVLYYSLRKKFLSFYFLK